MVYMVSIVYMDVVYSMVYMVCMVCIHIDMD